MDNFPNQNKLLISPAIVFRMLLVWGIVSVLFFTSHQASAQQLDKSNKARILVQTAMRVDVRTDLYAPVLEIPFREGEKFKAGDVLLRFDCARYEAEKNAAAAAANATNIEYRSKRKLYQYRAIGKDELQLAAARAAKARAELKIQQVRIAQCTYQAPFTGRVAKHLISIHEYPAVGKPILTILNDSDLELKLVVPSIWLRWLTTGKKFTFEIDETGETHSGIVTRLGAQVDPVSQTIEITGAFIKGKKTMTRNVLAGMSGTAYFSAGS